MADLVLDYGLLHRLAGSLRSLRAQIGTDVDAVSGRSVVSAGGEVGSDAIGNSTLYAALSAFYATCHKPFQDSMQKLEDLASLLESVATAFSDQDSDLATKANAALLQAEIDQWQAEELAWKQYETSKNQVIKYQYYDKDGVLRTATIPLWGPDRPPPKDPGAQPTSVTSPDGTITSTAQQVDGTGKVVTETSTVHTTDGLSYTETTTYTYQDLDGNGETDNVDYTTTVTHSDGTTEVITKNTSPDHTTVMTSTTDDGTTKTTVTPGQNGAYHSVTVDPKGDTTTTEVTVNPDGTGTKTVTGPKGTDVYTGDPNKDRWTKSSHEDPPPEYDPYTPINE
ncbi:Type IV secretion protein Rhs [Frankia sp. AiPs1]|uniref:LXG domain-containing protein n=1 Tax=Frankia sp. AiPa1 TaxID=573492 RepID=UPI00202AE7FC|nr:LXG domain-containing protein [Frankia sp. AiPa1]MCL9760818.1 LXG domain-containing protein [Frankia sp. AiPa1]